MAYDFTDEDIDFLLSPAGVAALAAVDRMGLTRGSWLADIATVRTQYPLYVSCLVETTALRRKSLVKLDGLRGSSTWLYTEDALQQATPGAVALHRAQRLAGRRVHDVTCSIGTELAALEGVAEFVFGSDLDGIRLRMASHNVPSATLARADALIPVTADAVVIADPARRSGGRRRHDPSSLVPPLPDLVEAYRGRDVVVKCAPGLDFDRLDWDGEVEIVSLDGGVREACLWSAGLAGSGVHRRATVLSSAGNGKFREWHLTDADSDAIPERPPGHWIIDPDGAVVRAGLVRHYGARHGLWQLDPRIAYLTGDSVPPGVQGFRVLDSFKFTEKSLRQDLAARGCGSLEILVRGVDVDPALLRPRLKLRGSVPLSVVITRIGRSPVAFVCAARATPEPRAASEPRAIPESDSADQ